MCVGFVSDLSGMRQICVGFVPDLCRLVRFVSDVCMICVGLVWSCTGVRAGSGPPLLITLLMGVEFI